MTLKRLFRSIRQSAGRFFAILAIIALGVGLFAGLKNAQPAMELTADKFYISQNMYDFTLSSTLGLTEEDLSAFSSLKGVSDAEGVYTADALASVDGGDEKTYKIYSAPERIAKAYISEGRAPAKKDECVVDDQAFSSEDIGKTIKLSSDNSSDTLDMFSSTEFEIVGLAKSPRYIGFERGSSSVGSGKIEAFIYVSSSAFESEVYHEIFLRFSIGDSYFSEEYTDEIEELSSSVEDLLNERATLRYNEITDEINEAKQKIADGRKEIAEGKEQIEEAKQEIADGKQEIADGKEQISEAEEQYNAAIANGVPAEMLSEALARINAAKEQIASSEEELTKAEDEIAEKEAEIAEAEEDLNEAEEEIAEVKKPTVYALTLESNASYVNFKNDTAIVEAISGVFPIFFAVIAALVCMTTMTRMVNEERTQIGTLKALGYSDGRIALKYLLYAGGAALVGCLAGFFFGTEGLTRIIWAAYSSRYSFAPLSSRFAPIILVGSVAVSVLGALIVTYFSCRGELRENSAQLIRPKPPESGKRILLERAAGPLWNKLSFMSKVSLRGAFRYKKRMFMTLLGISGCTALVVASFGFNDSISDVTTYQYEDILRYDGVALIDYAEKEGIEELLSAEAESYSFAYNEEISVIYSSDTRSATAVAISEENVKDYINFINGEEAVGYPQKGETVLCKNLADILGAAAGDIVTIEFGGFERTFTVSGVTDNYLNNYAYFSLDDVDEINAVYFNAKEGEEEKLVSKIRVLSGVTYVTATAEERGTVDDILSGMKYVVVVLIIFAGALAFIVLYNLTNINIMERIREVATVKVLGFTPKETASYILRENIILSVIGCAVGLPLGKLLHWYIMSCVSVDGMAFLTVVAPWSYVFAFALSMAFAAFTCFLMRFKLNKIDMAESLKSVE